ERDRIANRARCESLAHHSTVADRECHHRVDRWCARCVDRILGHRCVARCQSWRCSEVCTWLVSAWHQFSGAALHAWSLDCEWSRFWSCSRPADIQAKSQRFIKRRKPADERKLSSTAKFSGRI